MKKLNQWFLKRTKLENTIILVVSAFIIIGYQIGYQQYNAIAWEKKLAECNNLDLKSREALNNEQFALSENLFKQRLKCDRDLDKIPYRERIYD